MEKLYLKSTLNMAKKGQPALMQQLIFASGPWKQPDRSKAFMASVGRFWTGLEAAESMLYGMAIDGHDAGKEFSTKACSRLYAEEHDTNCYLCVGLEYGELRVSFMVGDNEDFEHAALNDDQIAAFKTLVCDMRAHFGEAVHA